MKKKQTPKRKTARRMRYPHIGVIADTLGVSRPHLWCCLERRRKGRAGLVEEYKRYATLIAGQKNKQPKQEQNQ
jgi:hypothetical protein